MDASFEGVAQTPVLALTVAYDGAPFHGFARQEGLPTVQGRIEAALATLTRREVVTVGAGRTDTGVHALGQVVSFECTGEEPEPAVLLRGLNALSGGGISVREVRRARPGFSARFDAVSREYRYRITTSAAPPVFLSHVAWGLGRSLDLAAMREAAGHLVGEHDFRSFCVASSAEGQRTVRSIDTVEIGHEEHLGEECVVLRVVGNAFLHSMVRTLVGTLVEVGVGRRAPGWVAEVLAARDRRAAGQTAPAQGLTFWRVDYPDEVWTD